MVLDRPTLPVFVGCGANMEWYWDAITSTHGEYQHEYAGIPPYELREVPKPSDLEMHGLNDSGFNRFSVAYGLSILYGALIENL